MDLVDFLIERGTLPPVQRERVRALREERGESEPVILTRLGLVPEREMARSLAAFLGLRLVDESAFPAEPLLADLLAPGFLARARLLPLRIEADGGNAGSGGALVLAMADPTDRFAVESIRLLVGRKVEPCVAVPSEIDAAIVRLYGGEPSGAKPAVLPAGSSGGLAAAVASDPEDHRRLADSASEEPVIRFVNSLAARAVAARASDIHIEAVENRIALRLRIDGVLREIEPPPASLRANIVSRLKIVAQLNIAERRLPQDGRFRMVVEGREIDVRVSIVPTLHGESVVLRLLDRDRAPLALPDLGFSPAIDSGIRRLLEHPNGILLATGPTGSGKTSTLYAALQTLNGPERKILTVEDPVEYEIAGINQIPVRPAIGLTFATLLRSLLRQDPDVLLVGEIRDLETASIAVQASLTGHLVLSTVHTNDAPSTLTRLIDMGLEDYLLASVLRGVLAQRLVRRLCLACREPYEPMPELAERAGLAALAPPDGSGGPVLYRAVGCPACAGTGYHGRTAIAELLVMDETMHRLVLGRSDAASLRRAAIESAGMEEMRRDGLRKALAGITSFEEVMRVAGAG